jgi:acetyl esterase
MDVLLPIAHDVLPQKLGTVSGSVTLPPTLMIKDRNGPKVRYQELLIPVTDASDETDCDQDYGTDRFLAAAFVNYGWNLPLRRAARRRRTATSRAWHTWTA